MAQVGELDELARDCNAVIKDEVKRAKRKVFFWLITGAIASLAVKLMHWLLGVPENVNPWVEAVGGICGVVIVWSLLLYVPVICATAMVVEFRSRFLSLNKRLDSIESTTEQYGRIEKP